MNRFGGPQACSAGAKGEETDASAYMPWRFTGSRTAQSRCPVFALVESNQEG
jgi:hypothetical protein